MIRGIYPINGINIFPSINMPEFVPVLQLRNGLPISSEVREMINKNLTKLFGRKRYFLQSPQGIFTHPNNLEYLKRQLKNNV